jgi:protein SCO1/2
LAFFERTQARAEGVNAICNLSCPGATQASAQRLQRLRRRLDCRVKPGNEENTSDCSRRAAFRLAIASLAVLALIVTHEAGGGERLPVIGPAPPFTLTSQDGAPVSLALLRGKVVAVTFIYTGCPDICPLLTQKMVDVQDGLGAAFGAKIAFVSISLDPEHDTPEVLKDYAQFWGAKPEGWSFLTGSLEAVRDVTRRYGVFFVKKEDGSVEHSQLTTLVDADGQMRVQYLGARFDPEEFRRDLMSLVGEE